MNLNHSISQHTTAWSADPLHTPAGSRGMADTGLLAGSWPRGTLTEIKVNQQGLDILGLLMPGLSRLSRDEGRWICWVAPPWIPDVAALSGAGIDLSRVLLVHPGAQQDGLWVVEESLRSGSCSAVLAWPVIDDSTVSRRLRLAAEAGDTLGFLFHPHWPA